MNNNINKSTYDHSFQLPPNASLIIEEDSPTTSTAMVMSNLLSILPPGSSLMHPPHHQLHPSPHTRANNNNNHGDDREQKNIVVPSSANTQRSSPSPDQANKQETEEIYRLVLDFIHKSSALLEEGGSSSNMVRVRPWSQHHRESQWKKSIRFLVNHQYVEKKSGSGYQCRKPYNTLNDIKDAIVEELKKFGVDPSTSVPSSPNAGSSLSPYLFGAASPMATRTRRRQADVDSSSSSGGTPRLRSDSLVGSSSSNNNNKRPLDEDGVASVSNRGPSLAFVLSAKKARQPSQDDNSQSTYEHDIEHEDDLSFNHLSSSDIDDEFAEEEASLASSKNNADSNQQRCGSKDNNNSQNTPRGMPNASPSASAAAAAAAAAAASHAAGSPPFTAKYIYNFYNVTNLTINMVPQPSGPQASQQSQAPSPATQLVEKIQQ